MSTGIEYVAPRNEIEEKLAAVWENVLQRENIGMKDDFFALGGHSLKAVRLMNEYQKSFDVKLALKDLFTHTTLESHSSLIDSSKRSVYVEIAKVKESEHYSISDGQRRLWVLSQFEAGSTAYNMPSHIELDGAYDIDSFRKAIEATIDRHEILRTVFKVDAEGEVGQWILSKDELGFEIDYIDYREASDKEESVRLYIEEDSYKPFDLEKGPLLRASLLHVSEDRYVFYFNMHHIISDGWSMEVLTKDVFSYYESFKEGTEVDLPELRIQYKDYVAWQQSQLTQDSFQAHRDYWAANLSGELPLLNLPSRKMRPKVITHAGHSLGTYISTETTKGLKTFSHEQGGSLFRGLLSSWNVLFNR